MEFNINEEWLRKMSEPETVQIREGATEEEVVAALREAKKRRGLID